MIFGQSLSRHLPLKQGSESRQTLPKRVSDDSRHFIFRRRKMFSKLRTAVYPARMAPFGLKLWENAFQMIPDISFVDAIFCCSTKMFVGICLFVNPPKHFSAKCLFWRTCECLDVTIRCASKIHCQTYRFQPSTTLGGGVRKAFSVFFH